MDALTATVTGKNPASLIKYFADSSANAERNFDESTRAALARTSKKLSLFSGALSLGQINKIRTLTASSLKEDTIQSFESSMDVALASNYVRDLISCGSDSLYMLSSNGHLKHKTKVSRADRDIITGEIYRGTVGYRTNNDGEINKTSTTKGWGSDHKGDLGKLLTTTEVERSNLRDGINLANLSIARGKDPFSVL